MSDEFKVNDRRRVDADGEVTEASQDKQEIETSNQMEINFANFIISIATQAMMQMGVLPAPEGVEIPKNIDAAKQSIDILEMIKLKTKGNLEIEENNLLEDILYNLRISFVKAK